MKEIVVIIKISLVKYFNVGLNFISLLILRILKIFPFIATGTVCRDSTASKCHGKSVPSSHEKLVVDSILLPDEKTNKINHQFAETFADIGPGGYVCHPKGLIRYL